MTTLHAVPDEADGAGGERAEPNSVISKAQLIVEAFTVEDADLGLSELARRAGLAKPTVYRLAAELVEWGVLERNGPGYRLGLRLFELGRRVPRQRILREAALPYMQDLLQITQETVHLAIRDGLEVLYVEKLVNHRQVDRPSRVAGRLPLHCTATGKVLLAHSPPGVLGEVLAGGLQRRTPRTVTSPARLRAQLEAIRADGYALENEEVRIGHVSVAVPVFGAPGVGNAAAALSVTAPTSRAAGLQRMTAALRTAGLAAGRALRARTAID